MGALLWNVWPPRIDEVDVCELGVLSDRHSAAGEGRARSFLASLGAHAFSVVALLILGSTSGALRPLTPRSSVLTWVAPAPEPEVSRPVEPPKYKEPLLAPAYRPAPLLEAPPRPAAPAPLAASLPPALKITVETRSPTLPMSLPELPAMRAPVQTGVFGAREAVAANPNPKLAVQLGDFSQAVGGDRTAPRRAVVESAAFGAVGAAPTRASTNAVASSGFGGVSAARAVGGGGGQVAAAGFAGAVAGTATRAGGGSPTGAAGFGAVQTAAPTGTPRETVKTSGFREAVVVEPAAPAAAVRSAQPETAVVILDKPRPAYTDEARRLKIQGEVWLEVQFTASGAIRVLRVAKSLGHGLDENAIEAARAIRFRPALRGGVPVDSVAIARITFELAY